MFDSFVDVDDSEIFLCKITRKGQASDHAWFNSRDIDTKMIKDYRCSKDAASNESKSSEVSCNTDKSKVYTCELKSRTCGLQIICSNCGIILGYKDLLGSESCSQVAKLLVSFKRDFGGDKLYLNFTLNSNFKHYCNFSKRGISQVCLLRQQLSIT